MSQRNEEQDDAREMPSVNAKKQGGSGGPARIFVMAILVGVVGVGVAAVNGVFSKKPEESGTVPAAAQQQQRSDRFGVLPPPPELPASRREREQPERERAFPSPPPAARETERAAPLPLPPSAAASGGRQEMTPAQRKMQPLLVAFGGDKRAAGGSGSSPAQSPPPRQVAIPGMAGVDLADDLSVKLKGTQVSGSRASVLRDRTFFITQGQFLDCVLETAIDSTVSGMVRARLSRDVYGSDGRMALLERGTRLVGQYQRGMAQGEARLFVLWTRAETPRGVLINIDSPGADELGRAGMGGYVDYHFWQRFGAAILFSLIDDVGKYLVDLASEAAKVNQTITLDTTGETATQTAGIALENSINIPPTLHKNQGDAISIYVARDLDFRGVYGIEPE